MPPEERCEFFLKAHSPVVLFLVLSPLRGWRPCGCFPGAGAPGYQSSGPPGLLTYEMDVIRPDPALHGRPRWPSLGPLVGLGSVTGPGAGANQKPRSGERLIAQGASPGLPAYSPASPGTGRKTHHVTPRENLGRIRRHTSGGTLGILPETEYSLAGGVGS